MTDIFEQLASPFDPSEIDWRVGSTNGDKTKGMALAYIDARAVMDRLDMVVGPAGWQCRYTMGEGKTVCEISVKCGDEWVTKSDGAGNTDFEAEKGALSDAFKRAAVRWGIGRYLYNIASPWVPIEAKGKSHFITPEGKRTLDALLRGQKPPRVEPRAVEPPPAPVSTMAGNKIEAQGQRTVAQYKADCIAALAKIKTNAELTAWSDAERETLDKLEKASREAHTAIMDKVAETADRVTVKRAAAE